MRSMNISKSQRGQQVSQNWSSYEGEMLKSRWFVQLAPNLLGKPCCRVCFVLNSEACIFFYLEIIENCFWFVFFLSLFFPRKGIISASVSVNRGSNGGLLQVFCWQQQFCVLYVCISYILGGLQSSSDHGFFLVLFQNNTTNAAKF